MHPRGHPIHSLRGRHLVAIFGLESQIGELREDIEEIKDSNQVREQRIVAQIGELGDSIRVTGQRLLAQIRELADSMRAGDQRLFAEINVARARAASSSRRGPAPP